MPRLLAPVVGRTLEVFPVAVLTGARQTGKSTLARQPELFGDRTYVTLDDILMRDLARRDPELLLDRAERLVIDSELLSASPPQWPSLLADQAAPPEPWQPLARRGGYPVASYQLADADQRRLWFDGYTATYLERDLRQLSAVENLADLRRLMTALCLRLGGLANQAELARDLAVPSSTVQRYLNLLEVSYQLVRVPGYSVNRTRRLIKAPKIYWSDTGLAMHLAGEVEPRGAHLENLVLTDLLAWSAAAPARPQIQHWRTATGAEVDFVIELPDRLLPIEVKTAARLRQSDARHLTAFLDDYPRQAQGALLLYGGDDIFWIDRGVLAVPWYHVI